MTDPEVDVTQTATEHATSMDEAVPAAVICDILALLPPGSTLETRQVSKAMNALSPPVHSICIEVEVGGDGRLMCLSGPLPSAFPLSRFVRLRLCMQQIHRMFGPALRERLMTSLASVLDRCPVPMTLHAVEMRGPVTALLLGLEMLGACDRFSLGVHDVTLVGVHWNWVGGMPDVDHDSDNRRLSSALGALSSLKNLRLEGLSVNTTQLLHLTSVAVCSMTRLDAVADPSTYDWDSGSLTRIQSLQTFDICSPHDPHACRMLEQMTNLRSLTLFSTVHPAILASMRTLTYLHISSLPSNNLVLPGLRHLKANRISDPQCMLLRAITPNLERLEFRCCGRTGELLSRLPSSLVSISPMTPLSLHRDQLHHLSGITRLSMCLACSHSPDMLVHLPDLVRFTLAATDFRRAANIGGLSAFLAAFHGLSNLRQLKLICFDIKELPVAELAGLSALTFLELRGCAWTAAGLRDAVATLPRLRSLHVSHCTGFSKTEVQQIEHCSASLHFRVHFEGRVPFCPTYRFA